MKKLILIAKGESNSIDINEEDIDMGFLAGINDNKLKEASGTQMGIRSDYEFARKALWLDQDYDYILGNDSNGNTILVPLKKK